MPVYPASLLIQGGGGNASAFFFPPVCSLPSMKSIAVGLLASSFALYFAGCQSPRASRIQEKSALYGTLDATTQKRLAEGIVDVGDSADAVYIALGRPSSIQTRETTDGTVETWTYRNYVVGTEMAAVLSNNNPGSRYQGNIESPANPRHGPSISGTGRYGPDLSLSNVAGAATATLQIDLHQGKVTALRLPDSR